jgi:hypothetical protein
MLDFISKISELSKVARRGIDDTVKGRGKQGVCGEEAISVSGSLSQ